MPVNAALLFKATDWLNKIEAGFGRQLGKENLKKQEFWRELSKTQSYAVPSLLANSFTYVIDMLENLTMLHENPDLIVSQKQVIDLQAELLKCKEDQLHSLQKTVKTSVEDSVKAEIKSYSEMVQND